MASRNRITAERLALGMEMLRAGMQPREMYKLAKHGLAKESARVRDVIAEAVASSKLKAPGAESGVRSYVTRNISAYKVTVRPKGRRGMWFPRQRGARWIPLLNFAAYGTKDRVTKLGRRRGAMKGYKFMEPGLKAMESSDEHIAAFVEERMERQARRLLRRI